MRPKAIKVVGGPINPYRLWAANTAANKAKVPIAVKISGTPAHSYPAIFCSGFRRRMNSPTPHNNAPNKTPIVMRATGPKKPASMAYRTRKIEPSAIVTPPTQTESLPPMVFSASWETAAVTAETLSGSSIAAVLSSSTSSSPELGSSSTLSPSS